MIHRDPVQTQLIRDAITSVDRCTGHVIRLLNSPEMAEDHVARRDLAFRLLGEMNAYVGMIHKIMGVAEFNMGAPTTCRHCDGTAEMVDGTCPRCIDKGLR